VFLFRLYEKNTHISRILFQRALGPRRVFFLRKIIKNNLTTTILCNGKIAGNNWQAGGIACCTLSVFFFWPSQKMHFYKLYKYKNYLIKGGLMVNNTNVWSKNNATRTASGGDTWASIFYVTRRGEGVSGTYVSCCPQC
jgi:hypothetical protein